MGLGIDVARKGAGNGTLHRMALAGIFPRDGPAGLGGVDQPGLTGTRRAGGLERRAG